MTRTLSRTERELRKRSDEDGDLVLLLIADRDTVTQPVPRQAADQWIADGVVEDDDALFRKANKNLDACSESSIQDFELGVGVHLRSVVDSGCDAATHLAHPTRFADPSEYGLLLACPHAGAWLLHCIVDQHVVDALEGLAPIARGMHDDSVAGDGPPPVSPDLFWWRDGVLLRIPSRPARRKSDEQAPPQLDLPPSFLSKVLRPIRSR